MGVLSLVLAHKDEQQSTSAQNKYSMAFTLDDAVTGPGRTEKRVLFGSIPGESASASLVSTASVASPASSSSNSEVNSPSSTVSPVTGDGNGNSNKELETEDNSVTTIVPSKDEGGNNNSKESSNGVYPAEGSILIGSSGGASDDEDKDDPADQRIVFIERLMGLHFASPGESSASDSVSSIGSGEEDVDNKKKIQSAKWASRTRKLSPSDSSSSSSSASSSSLSSPSLDQSMPDSIQIQPHPMLRYAAAAMMSRLIAAAARAQMESQAREQALVASRGGGKDKDDDAEEESVPVLLASLRDGQGETSVRSRSSQMYGRPMARTSSRGPLFPSSSSSIVNRVSPSSRAVNSMESSIHPLLQHLQALQALSTLQRMQRQRELSTAASDSGRQGDRALVMVAIPIASQESRPNVVTSAGPYGGHFAPRPSHYYPGHSAAPAYSVPVPAYRPLATHAVPMHMAAPPSHGYYGQYHGQYGHRSAGHYMPPPPSPYSPYAHHHPAAASASAARSGQPLHPAYSHVRPVVEVPIEVPVEVPVHVPVPVAAYPAQAIAGHPAIHAIAAQAAALAGHRGPIEHDTSDTATSDSQDQIVLFYDAEFHPESETEGSNSNSNSNTNSNGQGTNTNQQSNSNSNDDLQSSASEHKPIHGKGHHFLSSSPLPSNPSYHKMKLFHEMMSQKHASQPGVRYLPIAIQSNDQNNNLQQQQSPLPLVRGSFAGHPMQQQHLQQQQQQQPQETTQQPISQSPAQQQSAFIVISADDQQQRDQATVQPVVVERR